MNDFKTIVDFSTNDQNQFEGSIKMFAGENIIQDDALIRISLSNDQFTFYIPDKETSFEGAFSNGKTELSGEFIFPDGSRHPIELKRRIIESNPVEDYRKLKSKQFNATALRSDLNFLYASLKENHPELYAFTSKDSMDALAEKLNRGIDTALSLEEFYLLTTSLTDAVQCSHTGVRLPKSYLDLSENHGTYFPFKLFFSDGKAFYISGNAEANSTISHGSEIIGINGRPIEDIIAKLFLFIPSEGCNSTTKYNELNKRFNELYFFIDDSENFSVKFKSGASIDSLIVASCTLPEINSNPGVNKNLDGLGFSYVLNDSVGLLRVSSFAVPDMDRYLKKLDSIFSDLKTTGTQDLIIDLRDNAGGHPIFAAQLLSYVTDKEFVYFTRNEEVSEFEPLYNKMQPDELNFGGNIYVFINGGCLSTTGHLISLLKFNTDAVFIGEEPGSTFRCNDFSMQSTLPNTKIQLNVPRTTFKTAVSGFDLCQPFPIDHEVNIGPSNATNQDKAYLETFKSIFER